MWLCIIIIIIPLISSSETYTSIVYQIILCFVAHAAGVFGGAIGAVCLVTIRIVVRRISTKRCTGKIYEHPRIHPNEAYSILLQLRRNELAIEITGKPPAFEENNGPHYDEITLPKQNEPATQEPVYAEIGK